VGVLADFRSLAFAGSTLTTPAPLNIYGKMESEHTSNLSPLVASGDWGALIRYSLAHDHPPAFTAAIAAIETLVKRDSRWIPLQLFVEGLSTGRFDPESEPPHWLFDPKDTPNRVTLAILYCFPRAVLCTQAGLFPVASQESLVEIGIRYAEQATTIALGFGDRALGAFFMRTRATGLFALSKTKEAIDLLTYTLNIYLALEKEHPDQYKQELAYILYTLGVAKDDLSDYDEGRRFLDLSLDIYRHMLSRGRDVCHVTMAKALERRGLIQQNLGVLDAALVSLREALISVRHSPRRLEQDRYAEAQILNNLGIAQHQLEELRSADSTFKEALTAFRDLAVQRPEIYRINVARVLNNRGRVQLDLQNVPAAVSDFQDALAIARDLASPHPNLYKPDVAHTLKNLGRAQLNSMDVRAGLDSFNEALKLLHQVTPDRPDAHRAAIANVLKDLGDAHHALDNHPIALKNYQDSLHLHRELAQKFPRIYRLGVVSTLNDVGNVFRELKQFGKSREYHEEALALARNCAQLCPHAASPSLALTLNNLGTTLCEMEELELAHNFYVDGLDVFRVLAQRCPHKYRHDVAMALTNLGSVQMQLNDLEGARKSFREALIIREHLFRERPDVFRAKLASTLNNFACVERELSHFASARELLTDALNHYREMVRSQSADYSSDVAMVLGNLGSVHREVGNFEAARECFQKAFELYRNLNREVPRLYRLEEAKSLSSLGVVHAALGDLEIARDILAECIMMYRELSVLHNVLYRSEVATALNSLGIVQQKLQDFDRARLSFIEASRLIESDSTTPLGAHLRQRQQIWTNLGNLDFKGEGRVEPNYGSARDAFRHAVSCAEDLRGRLHDRSLRADVQSRMFLPYEMLVRTSVALWETRHDSSALDEGVFVAEQSRSRSLIERIGEIDLLPRKIAPNRFADFLRLRRELEGAKMAMELKRLGLRPDKASANVGVNRSGLLSAVGSLQKRLGALRRLQSNPPANEAPDFFQLQTPPKMESDEADALVKAADARLANLFEEFREADPEWDPDRPIKPLSSSEIRAFIPTDIPTAFVQFSLADDIGIALVLTSEAVECVQLPAFPERVGAKVGAAWIGAYTHKGPSFEWEEAMDERLSPVSDALLPLWSALKERGIQRLVLSPNRWLHLFPLHACFQTDGNRRAADDFEISYTPSFSILGRCATRSRKVTGSALIVGNPTGDLEFTKAEVELAKRHFPKARILEYPDATKSAILAAAPESSFFIYTGHATFDAENPMSSSLILETTDRNQRSRWLSLSDAFSTLDLGQCSLAVLNGCESGLLLPNSNDEYLALASGFLHAGATCVLSTLWSVHDLPAALLMDRFHYERSRGRDVGVALQKASCWLRNDITDGSDLLLQVMPRFLRGIPKGSELHTSCLEQAQKYAAHAGFRPPFASPAHWAAFTAVGKAW
jgi:CHAT domain-containing protein/tetratricopeptide (TPR) repeat protein